MGNSAVKIAVIESEKGWGRKVDDWMVCLTKEDAKKFQKEYNAQNPLRPEPEWYMQVEGEPVAMDITDAQMEKLKEEKRIWLSQIPKQ